jgi:hypothetical protein
MNTLAQRKLKILFIFIKNINLLYGSINTDLFPFVREYSRGGAIHAKLLDLIKDGV